MTTAIHKISIDSQMLYERLQQAQPGDIITYDELNILIGRDVQREAYNCLFTARTKARSLNRLAFGVIPNLGLKCLEDVEVVATGYDYLQSIRRKARSGFKTLICLNDYQSLPENIKHKHNAVATLLAFAMKVTAPKKITALEGIIAEKMQKLTFKQTLEFFGNK